jgi:hypothetical protein
MTTFAEYVNGRTVAVVGPAAPVGDQSPEIEAHDLIVRFARFTDSPAPIEGTGHRTNISYYNAGCGRAVIAGDKRIPSHLWCRFKAAPPIEGRDRWGRAVRCVPKVRNPNMVPLSTHDLCAAGAAKVTVFCADFYLSEKPYGDDLSNHQPVTLNPALAGDIQEVMRTTLTHHNQIQMRKLMRSLLGEYPALTGDERFLRTLAMDDNIYTTRLAELWPTLPATRTWIHTDGRARPARVGSTSDRRYTTDPDWQVKP